MGFGAGKMIDICALNTWAMSKRSIPTLSALQVVLLEA